MLRVYLVIPFVVFTIEPAENPKTEPLTVKCSLVVFLSRVLTNLRVLVSFV